MTDFVKLLASTAGSFVFLSVLFIPMEKVFPAKEGQKTLRPNWLLDFCFFIGQYLLWSGLVLGALHYFSDYLTTIIPLSFQEAIQSQPWWVQAIEALLFSDILIYWGHRLQHRVEFLWRFHKVHHSAEHLDWLAAHREHPLDSIYTIGLINLPAFIMGFNLETIAGVIAFRGVWAIYIHSNVRFPIGPLRMLIGAPELHHWHHDLDRNAGNYANISPLMDILFGTYTCPDHEPKAFGIHEEFPKNYVGQMLAPMMPKKWWQKLEQKWRGTAMLALLLLFVACSNNVKKYKIVNEKFESSIELYADSSFILYGVLGNTYYGKWEGNTSVGGMIVIHANMTKSTRSESISPITQHVMKRFEIIADGEMMKKPIPKAMNPLAATEKLDSTIVQAFWEDCVRPIIEKDFVQLKQVVDYPLNRHKDRMIGAYIDVNVDSSDFRNRFNQFFNTKTLEGLNKKSYKDVTTFDLPNGGMALRVRTTLENDGLFVEEIILQFEYIGDTWKLVNVLHVG